MGGRDWRERHLGALRCATYNTTIRVTPQSDSAMNLPKCGKVRDVPL